MAKRGLPVTYVICVYRLRRLQLERASKRITSIARLIDGLPFRLVSLVSWGSGLAGVVTITGTENWVELCDDPPTLDVDLSSSGNAAAGSVECIYAGSENLRFFNGVTSDLLITCPVIKVIKLLLRNIIINHYIVRRPFSSSTIC